MRVFCVLQPTQNKPVTSQYQSQKILACSAAVFLPSQSFHLVRLHSSRPPLRKLVTPTIHHQQRTQKSSQNSLTSTSIVLICTNSPTPAKTSITKQSTSNTRVYFSQLFTLFIVDNEIVNILCSCQCTQLLWDWETLGPGHRYRIFFLLYLLYLLYPIRPKRFD